jgi:hypothetical protein
LAQVKPNAEKSAGISAQRAILRPVPILAEFEANSAARRLCACATQAC